MNLDHQMHYATPSSKWVEIYNDQWTVCFYSRQFNHLETRYRESSRVFSRQYPVRIKI